MRTGKVNADLEGMFKRYPWVMFLKVLRFSFSRKYMDPDSSSYFTVRLNFSSINSKGR